MYGAMYAALLRFAPRDWLTLSLSQAEIEDRSLKKNANILGSNYSDLKFIGFAFLHRRNSIMCVCVIV